MDRRKGNPAGRGKSKEVSDLASRSKFLYINTLLCLVKAMEGKHLTVDIRNDSSIQGKLVSVDPAMGLTMEKVVLKNARGHRTRLDQFYLQGRNIIYVHIPDEVNIIETLDWELNKAEHYQSKERDNRQKLAESKRKRSEAFFKKQEQRQKSSLKGKESQHQ